MSAPAFSLSPATFPVLLIDGYNLLHATDLFGAGAAAGTLEGSREALLSFLAGRLTKSERRRATIVFDAASAPPGLPATISHQGMTVCFARGYPDADTMIEAMLEELPRGKGVLVVSGDRRVQRAARQRGALWQDAADWYRDLRARPGDQETAPPDPASVGDATYWAETFADEPTLRALAQDAAQDAAEKPAQTVKPTAPSPKTRAQRTKPRSNQRFGEGVFEGFPPGYADDLADEFGDQSIDDPGDLPRE